MTDRVLWQLAKKRHELNCQFFLSAPIQPIRLRAAKAAVEFTLTGDARAKSAARRGIAHLMTGESHLDFCRERKANKRPARRSGASSGRIFRRQLDHRRPNAIALHLMSIGIDLAVQLAHSDGGLRGSLLHLRGLLHLPAVRNFQMLWHGFTPGAQLLKIGTFYHWAVLN